MTSVDSSVLDDPFTEALRGPQKRFARSLGRISTFDPQVSVFYGHPRDMTDQDYADMAALTGTGRTASLRDRRSPLPARDLAFVEKFDLVQYDGSNVTPADDPEMIVLGESDVAEMTALVELTKPGPFLPQTIEMGTYLGWRDTDGRLMAMAGQRLHLPGWTEISAVCTHPEARGRGLARRLVAAVANIIVSEGDRPFLHTTADNPATRLYESMGFVLRGEVDLEIVRVTGE